VQLSTDRLDLCLALASLSQAERDALRHDETEKRILAKIDAQKRVQATRDEIERYRRTERHSSAHADIILDFFRTDGVGLPPTAVEPLGQNVKDAVRNQNPLRRPTVVKLPRRLSSAELFQLTKPTIEWRESERELGFIVRWLANLIVSAEPEPEIRERGMNKAQMRWSELVPKVTPAEQYQRQAEHYRWLSEGPHTQH